MDFGKEGTMQKIRLWEITADNGLAEMAINQIALEERLEDWLESDISVLDPNLLVIGRQVRTYYGGEIDLLCLDSAGDTVVVELKKGRTPREVTAQTLDYASWVKDLSRDELLAIANPYLKSKYLPPLEEAFSGKFETPLPDVLNDNHRSLVVAEETDGSTERIVRYLSDFSVPINVVTVRHFRDKEDRKILARVYLIEPEVAEAKAQSRSKRTTRNTLAELEAMADENGIGEMFRLMREGVRDILIARPYLQRVWYGVRLPNGGQRLLLIVYSVSYQDKPGMSFTVHASRFKEHLKVSMDQLKEWLPENTQEDDVTGWSGSDSEERKNAQGLAGSFEKVEEVETFLTELKKHTAQASPRPENI